MEKSFGSVYRNKKVLITGHTGFKGSWLSQWMLMLGADVYGYALEAETDDSCFNLLGLKDKMYHQISDIRDFDVLKKSIEAIKPDIIFHLAAQSLVTDSYKIPLETVAINTLGTANVLEAVRQADIPTAIIAVTTDKCYANQEWTFGYRENDALGGYDPYSSSKAAAEILIASWRNAFFNLNDIGQHGVKLASVRAGNVIGGGDWNRNHIVPDCIKALNNNISIEVRNPDSTRPWQHVLEALGGYIILGSHLLDPNYYKAAAYCEAFNFGPLVSSNKSVYQLVEKIIKNWNVGSWHCTGSRRAFHEGSLLSLSIDKAYHRLNWLPIWDFDETIKQTVDWYKIFYREHEKIADFTRNQILNYQSLLDSNYEEKSESHIDVRIREREIEEFIY